MIWLPSIVPKAALITTLGSDGCTATALAPSPLISVHVAAASFVTKSPAYHDVAYITSGSETHISAAEISPPHTGTLLNVSAAREKLAAIPISNRQQVTSLTGISVLLVNEW